MGHRPDVGLVDAHAERVGGDDDLDLAIHEAPLRLGAGVAGQAGVVGGDLDAQRAGERLGERVGAAPRPGVDDRRAGRRVFQRGGDPAVLVGRRAARHDAERQIRPVKASRDADRVCEVQARGDVGRDLRRRRCGRRNDRGGAQPAAASARRK